jgi:hypothetical protein
MAEGLERAAQHVQRVERRVPRLHLGENPGHATRLEPPGGQQVLPGLEHLIDHRRFQSRPVCNAAW